MTHRTFYLEVSQYRWPMLYPSHFFDLADELRLISMKSSASSRPNACLRSAAAKAISMRRAAGFNDEADRVAALAPKPNATNAAEVAAARARGEVARMQDLVLPEAHYQLIATLHQVRVHNIVTHR
jgi:hypothetical protein